MTAQISPVPRLDLASSFEPVLTYHRHIDAGTASAGIDCFTEDATFEARGERLQGKAEIAGFLAHRQGQTDRHTVHTITNPLVTGTAERAVVTAFVLLHVRQPDASYRLERVLDTVHELVPDDAGRWRVAVRRSRPLHPTVQATGPTP
ncbi:nuclear transport factor 2 family protein [Micromonospora sp. DT31]|uniref:nuclear transport factor 2 family protein n=1 Tax=Micromonospora sp. DT31 TaxID=3393434 RepID=UPI003CFA2EC4